MKNLKRFAALALSATIILGTFTGCISTKRTSVYSSDTETTAPEPSAATNFSNEGKVLNILAWNEEFMNCLAAHYPGYVKVDEKTGTIGDVTVKWYITPNENNAYQYELDQKLFRQRIAETDAKIDLFLIESDYASKYVNTSFTMSIYDLGITDSELANQYKYTQTVVQDSAGALKGLSWQACPGVMIYNREIAKAAFGSDDPGTIQSRVCDWDTFAKSAAAVNAKGYYMVSGYDDTYRVFSNNVTSLWAPNNELTIDDNLMKWVEQTKTFTEKGYNNQTSLWDEDWKKGFYPDGKVFCYFGPAWLFDSSMEASDADSIAAKGGWAVTEGPERFFWGGSWICAATGTDNPGLAADIMRQMTTNQDVMKEIVIQDNDFVNNKTIMEELANDPAYKNEVLGGQNPLAMLCEGAEKIELKYLSYFDQGCNEEFQAAMKKYFNDEYSLNEALIEFETKVIEKYPALKQE